MVVETVANLFQGLLSSMMFNLVNCQQVEIGCIKWTWSLMQFLEYCMSKWWSKRIQENLIAPSSGNQELLWTNLDEFLVVLDHFCRNTSRWLGSQGFDCDSGNCFFTDLGLQNPPIKSNNWLYPLYLRTYRSLNCEGAFFRIKVLLDVPSTTLQLMIDSREINYA